MQKNKFIQVFFELTAAEKVAFKKWVHSPFCNSQAEICILFDYIYDTDIIKSRSRLDRTELFAAVFPNQLFRLPQLRYLLSDLMKLLEGFLVYQYRKDNSVGSQLDLAMVYKKKQLPNLSQQALAKAHKIAERDPRQDIQQLENSYELEWMHYQLTVANQRSKAPNLQLLNDTFDSLFLAGKLKHACRILSYQGMYAKQYDLGLLPQILSYIQQKPELLKTPAIALYYYYYMAATSIDSLSTTYFKQFKQYLGDYQAFFPLLEIGDLYKLAINYTIKRLNTANRNYYLTETYQLYKEALKQDLLLEKEKISPFAFSNIVAVALGLGFDEWAEKFIADYSVKLDEKWQVAQRNYNLSRLYFYRKDYEQTARLLSADDFDDLHLNLSAKVLLLKTYYHLDEFQLLEALVHRFKVFLRRQKTLGYHKQNYNNILRFMKRLLVLNPYSKKEKDKLHKEIEGTELLTEKSWLLEQL